MAYAIKLLCLGIYVLGLASAVGLLPAAWSFWATIAALLIVAHVVELLFMFKYVRLYRGSLAVSVLLTILFGILHWKPLANAAARDNA